MVEIFPKKKRKFVIDIGAGDRIHPEATHAIDVKRPRRYYARPKVRFKMPKRIIKYWQRNYLDPPEGTRDRFHKVVSRFNPAINLADTKRAQRIVAKAIDHYAAPAGQVEITAGSLEDKKNVVGVLKSDGFTKIKITKVPVTIRREGKTVQLDPDYRITATAPVPRVSARTSKTRTKSPRLMLPGGRMIRQRRGSILR